MSKVEGKAWPKKMIHWNTVFTFNLSSA